MTTMTNNMIEPVFTSFSVILLAVVFFAAGAAKIKATDTLEGVIGNFRLLPKNLVRPVALVLPPVEIAVAAALLLPATRVFGAVGAAALLLVFTIAISINLARGRREIDCGCFSSELKQNLSAWMVVRNLVLTACALWLVASAAGAYATIASPSWAAWLLGALGAGFAIVIYVTSATLLAIATLVAERRASTGNG